MKENGYIPKNLLFDKEARTKLLNGITAISAAVKSTLGPRGQTVIIESPAHTHGITITKDGVTVAKAIELEDPVENLAVNIMKQAADKTSQMAGDGTTTAIVLTEALVKAAEKWIKPYHNVNEIVFYMRQDLDVILKNIEKRSRKVTHEMLIDVATISANADKELGKIIADAYKEVGDDGVVTVEKAPSNKTYAEITNGIKVDRGYTSPLFVTDQRRDECILEGVKILVCDQEINNILQIENILKPVINGGEKLLIIGNCSQNVVNTLAANVMRNGLKFCNIAPPSFGYRTQELMQDIAFAVGATYFSEKTGDDLSLMSMSDLGSASKVRIGKDSTVIITEDKELSAETVQRVQELREQQENLTQKGEKDFVNERIASLVGGIGCIYVGGSSDVEQKEKFDRVDDAVCAVRSALQEGIVPGSGLLLYDFARHFGCDCEEEYDNDVRWREDQVAEMMFKETLKSPLRQIYANAGIDEKEILKDIYTEELDLGIEESDQKEPPEINDKGYDINSKQHGDLFELGIIDPAKVTKHALINAVSVATTIISTNAIVTHTRA